jgi:hypothetical protein
MDDRRTYIRLTRCLVAGSARGQQARFGTEFENIHNAIAIHAGTDVETRLPYDWYRDRAPIEPCLTYAAGSTDWGD